MKTLSYVSCLLAFVVLLAGAGLAQATLVTVAADDFTRADSDTYMGSTSVGGYAWTHVGVANINSNQVWGGTRTDSYSMSLPDLNVANGLFTSDVWYNLTHGSQNSGVNFAAIYRMRTQTADTFDAGGVEVRVRANGALQINENVGGTVNTLYDDNPFLTGAQYTYAPGSLPATIGGVAYDTGLKGYLDNDGSSGYTDHFNFGVLLDGTSLSVLYNGQVKKSVTLTGSGNSGANIFQLGRISNETGGSSLTYGNVGFDNLVIQAPVPEPGTMALLTTGLVGLLCYAWRKRK
jgi:hypothetical protein